jgi:hypothetical protein
MSTMPRHCETDPEIFGAGVAPGELTLVARSLVVPLAVTLRTLVLMGIGAGCVALELATQIHGESAK